MSSTVNVQAMKALFQRIGFTQGASDYMVTEQGIDSMAQLDNLDEETVTGLCKLCRKPGGTVGIGALPARRQAAAAANAPPPHFPNPGNPVPMLKELNLKIAIFLVKHRIMIDRTPVFTDITSATVTDIKDFKKELESMKSPEQDTAPQLTQKRIFEFFDEFKEFLAENIGPISNRPLAYVVREKEDVKDAETDPMYGQLDSIYNNNIHEIEHRAPITSIVNGVETQHKHFKLDNTIVWKLLLSILTDTTFITYIKRFASKQDGRSAFKALKTHLLGEDAINNHASKAENRLTELNLDGQRKKNWDFNKYVLAHKEQHIILEKLTEYGYAGIDDNSKIRYFLQGITDPKLDAVKANLACQTGLIKTFDYVVTSYRTYMQTHKETTANKRTALNISQLTSNSASNNARSGNRNNRFSGSKKRSPDDDGYVANKNYDKSKIATRYYASKEWNALKSDQRNYLREQSRIKKTQNISLIAENKKLRNENAVYGRYISKVEVTRQSQLEDTDDESVVMIPKKKRKVKTLKRNGSD